MKNNSNNGRHTALRVNNERRSERYKMLVSPLIFVRIVILGYSAFSAPKAGIRRVTIQDMELADYEHGTKSES